MRNVALTGCGYWGKNIARNMSQTGALRAICDAAPKNLEQFRDLPDVRLTNDYPSLLADPAVKGVMIATPAETHYRLGKMAMDAGKDVYIEKPLALETSHAVDLVETAEEKGLILMVGHILHYHPAVVKLKEMIAQGVLGRIHGIYSNRMSLGKIRREENILWSFAPHDVSLIQSIVKQTPERIFSSGGYFLHDKIADTTLSAFEYANGVRAHLYVSWLHPFKEQRFVVVGSRKMLVFNDVEKKDKLLLYPHEIEWKNNIPAPAKKDAVSVPFDDGEPLKAECMAFLNAMESRKPPVTDGREGLETLRILKMCQLSLEKREIVEPGRMGEPDDGKYFAHPTAVVDESARIGQKTRIWHFSHIMESADIGDDCNIGQNVFVGNGVKMGANVKIQNNVSVYSGVELEDDVFCGPSMVFTNVNTPRSAINRKGALSKTLVKKGATLGANCTIVCGEDITIGEHAFVGAGAVVTKDVAPFALVVGAPAKPIGWVCRCGLKVEIANDGAGACVSCAERYVLKNGALEPLDIR